MLAFILPLKPKSQSKDWKKDCALLEASIRSLQNQQSGNYRIYVVFSDDPQLKHSFEEVAFISFPFSFRFFDQIPYAAELLSSFDNDKIMMERRWDKSRKIFWGCSVALKDGCDYVMAVDADDLVSGRLVQYIDARTREKDIPGFFIDKGFLYYPRKKRLISIDRHMQNFNGSTHILKADFIKIPDFDTGEWHDYNLFTSHGWLLHRLRETYGIQLEAIPFPAVIYVAHGGNISGVAQLSFKERVKRFIKFMVKGQTMNNSLKKEFMIMSL